MANLCATALCSWISLILASGDVTAAGSPEKLVRTDTSLSVPIDSLDSALSRTSVLARLHAGDELSFFGVSFRTKSETTALISASSDVLFAACLQGDIQSVEATAGPGQLILWRPGKSDPEAFDFEVKRLLATLTVPLDAALQTSLDALVAKQNRLMFWGALERTPLNIQALDRPALEPMRRDYLRRPAIIRLRLKHDRVNALARGVAEAFVSALSKGDVETIADLLNPRLFAQGARGRDEGMQRLLRLRHAFAERIAAQDWRARLAAAPKIVATGGNAVWFVAGTPLGFTVTLEGFDRFPFVTSIETVTAPPKAKTKEQPL